MNAGLIVVLLCLISGQVLGGANDGNPEVKAILAEIRQLIIKHYNVQIDKPRPKPTPKALADAELADDIRLTVDQANHILQGMKRLWGYETSEDRIAPNVTGSEYWTFPIKYTFNATQHTDKEKEAVRAGFKLWEDNTCVTYKEYANEDEIRNEPHLLIIKGTGCYSDVGISSQTGQIMSIAENCTRLATVAHEAGHALGLWHEFMRPDRDEHVKVFWDAIITGKEYNFWIVPDDYDPADTGYDYSSVMHYDSLRFSNDIDNKKRVIVPRDIHQITAIGQRVRLQFNDIKRVNFAYDCISKSCSPDELKRPCQNGGYQDPKNCKICKCPPGTSGDACDAIAQSTGEGMAGCGGKIWMDPCSIRTLTLPTFPRPYGEDVSCTWRIKSSAKGLVFAFQDQPDMPCSPADTCYDFVEIRSNMSALASPGRFFCACGENKGRVVAIDDSGEALVRFASTTVANLGGAGTSRGFLLNVYTTCNNTKASNLFTSCTITSTGFESCTGVAMPQCAANEVNVVDPLTTTTPGPTTTRQHKEIILIIDAGSTLAPTGALLVASLLLMSFLNGSRF